jgi:hypothetical protein
MEIGSCMSNFFWVMITISFLPSIFSSQLPASIIIIIINYFDLRFDNLNFFEFEFTLHRPLKQQPIRFCQTAGRAEEAEKEICGLWAYFEAFRSLFSE